MNILKYFEYENLPRVYGSLMYRFSNVLNTRESVQDIELLRLHKTSIVTN